MREDARNAGDSGRTDRESADRPATEQEEKRKPEPPETSRHPAPGIDHEPEPDAENLVPRKEGPGTL